jgi:pilus assembly protein CpaB
MKYPKFTKKPIKKTWLILGVAIGVGLLAAFIAQQFISRQLAAIEAKDKNKRMVNVVVAKTDLAKGVKLSAQNVAVRPVPAEYAISSAVMPEQYDRVEGQALAYPAKAGEMIIWSMLEGKRAPTFSTRIEVGRRAMTVPVDEINSISGMLEPGDLVDLMVTVTQKNKKMTLPLLQNVTVLATGQRTGHDIQSGEKRQYTTVTFDTTVDEAQTVIVARDMGKLTALLRNPNDKALMSGKIDLATLMGMKDGTQTMAEGVPVLYGGGKLPEDIGKLGVPHGTESATSKPNVNIPTAGITAGIEMKATNSSQ